MVDTALEDARVLEAGGLDALSLENMGDAPFFASKVPAETVASFGRVLGEVRRQTELPIGVNVLRNDGRAALAIALAFGGSFVRVNVLSEVYATDQGLIEGIGAEPCGFGASSGRADRGVRRRPRQARDAAPCPAHRRVGARLSRTRARGRLVVSGARRVRV